MSEERKISEHQDRFEHQLAMLMIQGESNLTYAEARKHLAESEGAAKFAAQEALYEKERSWVDRFFRWLGL